MGNAIGGTREGGSEGMAHRCGNWHSSCRPRSVGEARGGKRERTVLRRKCAWKRELASELTGPIRKSNREQQSTITHENRICQENGTKKGLLAAEQWERAIAARLACLASTYQYQHQKRLTSRPPSSHNSHLTPRTSPLVLRTCSHDPLSH